MTITDVTLLAKKVAVGIVVTTVPFIIIFGGLLLTQTLLSKNKKPQNVQQQNLKPHETRTSN